MHVSLDGDAFVQPGGPAELASLLEGLAARVRDEQWTYDCPMRLRDGNGNRVGYAVLANNDGGCGDPDCTCPECVTGRANAVG